MALVRPALTGEQTNWLLNLLDKRLDDSHWSRSPTDPEEQRYLTDVLRELRSAAAYAGIRPNPPRVGQCEG